MRDYRRTDAIAFPYGEREQEIVDWYERWRMPHFHWWQAQAATGCPGEFLPQWERAMRVYYDGDPSFLSYLLAQWPGSFPLYARKHLAGLLYEGAKRNTRIRIDYINRMQITELAALTATSLELRGETLDLALYAPAIEGLAEHTGASATTLMGMFRKRLARIRKLRKAALAGKNRTRRYRSGVEVDS